MIRGAVYAVDLGPPARARAGRPASGAPGLAVGLALVGRDRGADVDLRRPVDPPTELEVAGRAARFLVDQVRSIDVTHVHGDPSTS